MYILCRNREKFVQLLLNICFMCVAASRNISKFFKERTAASERYPCATASERKCAADIFWVCGCSWKHFIFLKERAAASKKILMCDCFLELCPLKKYFEVKNSLKTKMMFMYFWLNYCYENHHIERIPVSVQNINHLFRLASEIIETDRLHLFLLSDGTRIYEGKYLSSLENGIELIICTEEQIQKLSIYFELKRYLSLKNISYPLNIDYFI